MSSDCLYSILLTLSHGMTVSFKFSLKMTLTLHCVARAMLFWKMGYRTFMPCLHVLGNLLALCWPRVVSNEGYWCGRHTRWK